MNTTTTSATPHTTTKSSNPFARGAMLGGKRIEHWKAGSPTSDTTLANPLRWRIHRHVILTGDLFYEEVPDAWIDKVFAVMALAPQHTYQVLTKRAERMHFYLIGDGLVGGPEGRAWRIEQEIDGLVMDARRGTKLPVDLQRGWHRWTAGPELPLPNVWLGVSVEDQQRADERIPLLLDTPAALRWISAEPLLGHIDLTTAPALGRAGWLSPLTGDHKLQPFHADHCGARLDWVVAGGESAQNKPGRPMHPNWARSLRDQCRAAGVPFHFKQWGDWVSVSEVEGAGDHYSFPDGATVRHLGKERAGRTLDGRTWDEFPEAGR